MRRMWTALAAVLAAGAMMGSADGSWLRRVSPAAHVRANPLVGTAEERKSAASSGSQIFYNECAKCHGSDGGGLHGRPTVVSDRIDHATDGDLFWLMTNGNPWKGMPAWNMLPVKDRWQLVTYLRAMNLAEDRGSSGAAGSGAVEDTRNTKDGVTR